jgi:hypothetical protein
MILIAHRGNIQGANASLENRPDYIQAAIDAGYQVEIDVREVAGQLILGHDQPDYPVAIDWLRARADQLWIHCKNISAAEYFSSRDLHWFWHESDTLTVTSRGVIWAYPGKQPIMNSIAVMPELHKEVKLFSCAGICSDNIEYYKYLLNAKQV